MEKSKKNKIIGLSLGILIVVIIVVSSTYAYWQITRTQKNANDIVAACLSLDLQDKSPAIDLDSAWPISDEEASSLTGYTFTVTNNCDEEINYIVGLNRVEEDNYLQDTSVKVRLDEQSSHVYGELSNVEYSDPSNTYTSRISKQVSVETIEAKGINEHTIRVWVSEDAPVTEQSKIFQGQVFITGGQGIEVKECFTIANDGVILAYDSSCGLEVKVPAEINGIKVKQINSLSFRDYNIAAVVGFYGELVETSGSPEYSQMDINLYFNELPVTIGETMLNSKDDIIIFLKNIFCEGNNECRLEDMGVNVLVGIDEYNQYDWSKYGKIEYSSFDGEITGVYPYVNIESIDLSNAKHLEIIAEGAFYDNIEVTEAIDENCTFHSSSGGDYYTCKGNLKELILPENGALTTIGKSSFESVKVKDVVIPASVEMIDEHAFSDSMLERVVFEDSSENPSQLSTIGWSAFNSCNIAGTLIIPGSVDSIGESAFMDNNLTKVIIKNTQENINVYHHAFHGVTEIIYDPNYTE